MSKRLPFWKSYEIPEQCQKCPYIKAMEGNINVLSAASFDVASATGVMGLNGELRRRKRLAQDCQAGPIAVRQGVTLCETANGYLDSDGYPTDEGITKADRRAIANLKPEDLTGYSPDDEEGTGQ